MIGKIRFALFTAAVLANAATLDTPEHFAGFSVGAEKKLVRWERIVEYMRRAADASPRIRTEELGKTTNGNPFIAVTVTSPENMKELARFKEAQHRLSDPRGLTESQAEQLIEQQKSVILITCNIHSTEIGSSQMALELVHRLATEDSASVRNILQNVILVLVPSLNPDGQIIVTDWYNKNAGTLWEYSPLAELYHKYTGHDDNRDAFMNTQVESRLINRLTYKEWLPHVFFDEHQMGNSGPRIFVPPFKDPINPNIDPTVWDLNAIFGYSMSAALNAKGHTGVIRDAMYTSWWQGGFLMQAWWHNMVGVLTEVASVNIASPVEQDKAKPGEIGRGSEPTPEQIRNRDPRKPLPAPRDTVARNTYPRPWLGGKWTLRDIVDYELTATYGLLEAAANNRLLLVRNVYDMNKRQIDLGRKEAPYAWIIPAAQHDRPAAARLAQILDELGVEVNQATQSFAAGGKEYPAGSYVVLMAQPYRAFAKDLLEKQNYPPQRSSPDGPIERPYDVTGWTLPYQMGVKAVEIAKKFDANLKKLETISIPPGHFEAESRGVGYEISHQTNNATIATNRLLKSGFEVFWTADGTIFVREKQGVGDRLRTWTGELGIDIKSVAQQPKISWRLKAPRVAIYRPWIPNMDEGWTRWVIEQYEFQHAPLRDADVKAGKLRDRYDAIVLPSGSKSMLMEGATQEWVRPEHRGGLGAAGVKALKEFVREGGTLIALGNSSLTPIEEFPLPLRNAHKDLKPGQFSCPGSILRIFLDNRHPAAFGMPEEAAAVFNNNVAFDLTAPLGDATTRVIAKYPASKVLMSGWIGGEEFIQDRIAAAEVTLGKGRVILLGFAVQNRAQPHGTFKLLFNSLHEAAAEGL
jgi:hypothetical protein